MYTSAAGKELHLSVDPKSPLLTFKWEGGGEIPQELQGLFTAEEMARKAFNMWRAKKEDVVGMEIAK
tara:strand:+ start:1030 stop:1230 length:201 start_codon:yes stop_codon:yes gene_type:complete